MYILGIDASLNGCGWAVIDPLKMKVIDAGVIIPKKETKRELTDSIKLNLIQNKICDVIVRYPIEKTVYIEQGFTRFNKATQALYKVRGVIEATLLHYDLLDIAPTSIKKAITGSGTAEKEAVASRITELFRYNLVGTYDVSDAIAVAYTGFLQKGD